MTLIELLILLFVAGVCGGIAQSLVGYSHGGCLVTIVLGFIGALLGTWFARVSGLPEVFAIQVGGQSFPIIWSIIGGALFSAVLSVLRRGRVRRETLNTLKSTAYELVARRPEWAKRDHCLRL